MEFNKFLGIIGSNEEDEEINEIIDNLHTLSNPTDITRSEYADLQEKTMGINPEKHFDALEVEDILDSSYPVLPVSVQRCIDEPDSKATLIDEAVENGAGYYSSALTLGLSDAIYSMTDQRIAPSVLRKEFEATVGERNLLSAMDGMFGESFEVPDADDDLSEDDEDYEDDSDDPYYDAD